MQAAQHAKMLQEWLKESQRNKLFRDWLKVARQNANQLPAPHIAAKDLTKVCGLAMPTAGAKIQPAANIQPSSRWRETT